MPGSALPPDDDDGRDQRDEFDDDDTDDDAADEDSDDADAPSGEAVFVTTATPVQIRVAPIDDERGT